MLMSNAVSTWFLLAVLLAATSNNYQCEAFLSSSRPTRQSSSSLAFIQSTTRLFQSESAEDSAEVAAEETPEEEEEVILEDPEVTELKEQIAELEATLKTKTNELQYLTDSIEDYTKTGYARKVAEMENMRRTRSSMQSSSKEAAEARCLKEFLSVKDRLTSLKEHFGEDEFGKQYNALSGALNTVFTDKGVTEYTTTPGDDINQMRMLVVESEHSEDFPKDTVLKPLTMGLELRGNVIRFAECVASLGSEIQEEESEETESEELSEEA